MIDKIARIACPFTWLTLFLLPMHIADGIFITLHRCSKSCNHRWIIIIFSGLWALGTYFLLLSHKKISLTFTQIARMPCLSCLKRCSHGWHAHISTIMLQICHNPILLLLSSSHRSTIVMFSGLWASGTVQVPTFWQGIILLIGKTNACATLGRQAIT